LAPEVQMKTILDQMEEHIAEIRNLQRKFDFHSKILEKLMISLNDWHFENNADSNVEKPQGCNTAEPQSPNTGP
jgi:hypothetical protein